MRDKYKQSLAANEKLKDKLREVTESITRGEGHKNKLLNDLKRWEILKSATWLSHSSIVHFVLLLKTRGLTQNYLQT